MASEPMAAAPGWREILGPAYGLSTVTLCLAVSLHALNLFVFSTLAPSIVRDIGGLGLLSWATTVYVVASIVGSASAGLVRGALGPRPAMLAAAALFVAGTAVCALAPNMPTVLGGRIPQGYGAGLAMASAHGMIRDLYPRAAWGRMFAAVSAVWGIASLFGPALGGVFATYVGWRTGLLTMVPLALLFMAAVLRAIPAGRGSGSVGDWWPVARLGLIGLAALLLGAVGKTAAPAAQVVLLAGALTCSAAAVAWERRAANKLFPHDMFRPTTVIGAGVVYTMGFAVAAVATGIYGPLLFQVLHGMPPLYAGYVVTVQSLGWTGAALVFAQLQGRQAAAVMTIGPVVLAAGVALTGWLLPHGPMAAAAAAMFVTGCGIGMSWNHVARYVLAAAPESDRHRVTGVMPTVQSLGIAFGSAAVGIVADRLHVAQPLTVETAAPLARWAYFALLPMTGLALLGALRVSWSAWRDGD